MNLGNKVKTRREALGLSQEELAFKMGYKSRTSINKIENGREVSQKIIVKLAEALHTSPAYLMGWDEEIEKDPVGTAELHVEMIMDKDFVELFEDFKKLTKEEKQMVKKIVRGMANE